MESVKKIELELNFDLAADRLEWLLRNTYFPEPSPSGHKPLVTDKTGALGDLALFSAFQRIGLCQHIIAINRPISIDVYEDDLQREPDLRTQAGQKMALKLAADEFSVATTILCEQKKVGSRYTENQIDVLKDYASAVCWAVNKTANPDYDDTKGELALRERLRSLVHVRLENPC